ncbi:hypothetical protein [Flavobacterium facile]|uniref:hypothetical protein n=1 Tax=Flavobacterium facile TaxID=2893174 RepID=UPI002E7A9C2C|nr:hypothetical protein [Flavobacterium sp. T-12]
MTREFQKAQQALQAQRKTVVRDKNLADYADQVYYINAKVAGASNTINLVGSNTKKEVGVTNLTGNFIAIGKQFPISAIRVMFSKNGNSEKEASYQDATGLPAELQNAELKLTQDNKVIFSLPMTVLQNFKNSDFKFLGTLGVLRDKIPFALTIEMPENVVLPADRPAFLRVELMGIQRTNV